MKRKLEAKKELYLCDPNKNVECRKTSCKYDTNAKWHECDCTTKKEFAMLDEHDEPIKAPAVYVNS